jgi:hypothetical protein
MAHLPTHLPSSPPITSESLTKDATKVMHSFSTCSSPYLNSSMCPTASNQTGDLSNSSVSLVIMWKTSWSHYWEQQELTNGTKELVASR